jgi:hypothetical protein
VAEPRVVCGDLCRAGGAKKLGAKILVAGGGRCNVAHYAVDPADYAGDKPNRIRKVLCRFDVPDTIEFFREQGVELKREETGKLFPVMNMARSVLDALLNACSQAGVTVTHPQRVETVERRENDFLISGDWGSVSTDRVLPALVPLILPSEHPLRELSGVSFDSTLPVRALGGKILHHTTLQGVPLSLPNE